MPPLGVMPFLIRAMGHRAFRRYGLSGERIAAAEALRHRARASGLRRCKPRRDARAHRRRAPAWRARRDRDAQGGRRRRSPRRPCPPSWRITRRTIRNRRRRSKASRASARSASRAGIRSRPTNGPRFESRSLQEKSRGADRAAQRRAGRRQRPAGKLGRAGVAQSQPLRISRADLSGQSAPHEIWDKPCYPDFTSLPEPPDHMVVLVPAAGVIETLKQRRGRGRAQRHRVLRGLRRSLRHGGRRARARACRGDRGDRARRLRSQLHGQCLRQEPARHAHRGPSAHAARRARSRSSARAAA